MDKLSIIIPAYNADKYIERCLNSIGIHNNIETIIINDGSTDRTQLLIEPFVEKFPNNFKLYNQNNLGVSMARKNGIDKATGNYISFVDSDDTIRIEKYQQLFSILTKTNFKIGMGRTSIIQPGIPFTLYNKKRANFINIDKDKINLCSLSNVMWDKIFTRDLLEFFTDNYQVNEDLAWIPFLYAKVGKILHSNDVIYNYIRRTDSSSFTGLDTSSSIGIENTINPLINLRKKFIIYELEKLFYDEINAICIKHVFERINGINQNKNIINKNQIISILIEILDEIAPNWKNNKYLRQYFKGFEFNDILTIIMGKTIINSIKVSNHHNSSVEEKIQEYDKQIILKK